MGDAITVVVDLKDLPDAYERAYNKGVRDCIERVNMIYLATPKDMKNEREQTLAIGYSLCRMLGIQPGSFVWNE